MTPEQRQLLAHQLADLSAFAAETLQEMGRQANEYDQEYRHRRGEIRAIGQQLQARREWFNRSSGRVKF